MGTSDDGLVLCRNGTSHSYWPPTVLTLLTLAGCGGGPEPPARPDALAASEPVALTEPDLVYQSFDRIRAAVALDDSTLLLTDQLAVYRLAMRSGQLDTLGRTGEGPGEHRNPVAVGLLPGGRLGALGRAMGLASWLPDGSRGDRVQYPPSISDGLRTTFDSFGIMVGSADRLVDPNNPATTDTLPLLRFEATGKADTIGSVLVPAMVQRHSELLTRPLYAATDAWGVTPGGDVWVLRGRDFVPQWLRRGSTTWVEGIPWPWRAQPTGPSDVRYFSPPYDTIPRPMAETKGPFQDAIASADGTIWARLYPPGDDSLVSYAELPVFAQGPRRVFVLPPGRRVIAVGNRAIFATVEGGDGTWAVERYTVGSGIGQEAGSQ